MEMGSKQQRDKVVSKQQPSGEGDTRKKRKQNQHQYPPCIHPHPLALSCCSGLTRGRALSPPHPPIGKSNFKNTVLMPPTSGSQAPNPFLNAQHASCSHAKLPLTWRPRYSARDQHAPRLSGGPHLVSWIHWWKALACCANSCRSLSFSSCRRCSFCSSSSLS